MNLCTVNTHINHGTMRMHACTPTVVPSTDTSHPHRIGLDPSTPHGTREQQRHSSNYVNVHSYTIHMDLGSLLPGPGDPYSTKTEGDILI